MNENANKIVRDSGERFPETQKIKNNRFAVSTPHRNRLGVIRVKLIRAPRTIV